MIINRMVYVVTPAKHDLLLTLKGLGYGYNGMLERILKDGEYSDADRIGLNQMRDNYVKKLNRKL